MSNTFLIKRSTVTVAPESLAFGEFAFGANGDLWIGNASNLPVKIGGIDVATMSYADAKAAAAQAAAQGYSDSAVADLQAQLNAEISARTAADAATLADAKSYTDTAVAGLVDSSPEALNTLNELAAALGNDANFATTVSTNIGTNAANLTQEIADRTAADATLQGNIDTLANEAQAAITALEAEDTAQAARLTSLEVEAARTKDAAEINFTPVDSAKWNDPADPSSVTPVNVAEALERAIESFHVVRLEVENHDVLLADLTATQVGFTDTNTGFGVADVQGAIEALNTKIGNVESTAQTGFDSLTADDVFFRTDDYADMFDFRLSDTYPIEITDSTGVSVDRTSADAINALARELRLMYEEVRNAKNNTAQVLRDLATQSSDAVAISGGTIAGVQITGSVFDAGTF